MIDCFLSGDALASVVDMACCWFAYGIGLGVVVWLLGYVVWFVIQLLRY